MIRGYLVAIATIISASPAIAQGSDPVAVSRAALLKAKADAGKTDRALLVARETYLRNTPVLGVRLSPDGSKVSYLRRTERGVDLMVQHLSGDTASRAVAGLQRAETAWAGDGRRLWLADEQGLAVIDGVNLVAKRILKWDATRVQRFWGVDARAPQHAIVHEQVTTGGAKRHRYLGVDQAGTLTLLLESALPLKSALLDAAGKLAFTAALDGPRFETVICRHSGATTEELLRCSNIEECRLVGYNRAPLALWVLSQHGDDKLTLRRWQQGGRWETVHRDPAAIADADAVLWSAPREDWLAAAYHDGRRRWYGNDAATQTMLGELERQLPHANLQLSGSNDGRVWLVHAQQGDAAADRYYLRRPGMSRLQPLFSRDSVAARMPPAGAAMHSVSYRASDGMVLHGYVMLPNGLALDDVPLIAWLHGGPITRVHDVYNGAMQLLVNRGYAVFVPNFRLSTGYGMKYMLAGKGDVGNGRVLADVIDGMDHLLALGIGNRARQAVMGMSFGGYASLLALSHHPGRFQFAFAGTPPTDYGWIKQWQAEHDSEAIRGLGPPLSLWFPALGFPYKDAAWRLKMQRESPLAMLPVLKDPAYIWAGARDDRVPLKSIVHFVGEARRLAKPVTLLVDPDGGHGPATRLGTEASLYLIEFAAHQHLGGGISLVSPELRAYLRSNIR